jgi:hypothetical protein
VDTGPVMWRLGRLRLIVIHARRAFIGYINVLSKLSSLCSFQPVAGTGLCIKDGFVQDVSICDVVPHPDEILRQQPNWYDQVNLVQGLQHAARGGLGAETRACPEINCGEHVRYWLCCLYI